MLFFCLPKLEERSTVLGCGAKINCSQVWTGQHGKQTHNKIAVFYGWECAFVVKSGVQSGSHYGVVVIACNVGFLLSW